MGDNLFFKATVTGKRQITIPKEVCELLNIQTGKQVIFKEIDGKIIFELEKEYEPCFACEGNREIDDKQCFICMGTGELNKEISSDVYKLIGFISVFAYKYNVKLEIAPGHIPVIKLISNEYTKKRLSYIEDKIQQMIIKQFR